MVDAPLATIQTNVDIGHTTGHLSIVTSLRCIKKLKFQNDYKIP